MVGIEGLALVGEVSVEAIVGFPAGLGLGLKGVEVGAEIIAVFEDGDDDADDRMGIHELLY